MTNHSKRELERRIEELEHQSPLSDGPEVDVNEEHVRELLEGITDEQDSQLTVLLEQLDRADGDGESEEAITVAIGGLLCGSTVDPNRLADIVDDDLLEAAG